MKNWTYGQWENCEVDGMPFLKAPVRLADLAPGFVGVYAIKWADGSTYEYVGQSKCIRSRLLNHEHGFLNCRFEILEWQDLDDLQDRLEAEGRWIRRLSRKGHDLLNDCSYARAARKQPE